MVLSFLSPLNVPFWFFYWRSTFSSTCMDLHIDGDGGQLYTEGNEEHQGADECRPCSYSPSFRVGGFHLSFWGRCSIPLWYIRRDGWSADERLDHSAMYSQCSGCVDMDLGDCSDEGNFFCSIYATRGYTLFLPPFCSLCGSDHVRCFCCWCQWTIKTLDHDTNYLWFSASPYTLQPYPSI